MRVIHIYRHIARHTSYTSLLLTSLIPSKFLFFGSATITTPRPPSPPLVVVPTRGAEDVSVRPPEVVVEPEVISPPYVTEDPPVSTGEKGRSSQPSTSLAQGDIFRPSWNLGPDALFTNPRAC